MFWALNYLVTGATGAIGKALLDRLASARLLSRNATRAQDIVGPRHSVWEWDPNEQPPHDSISGADCVVHLAGEPVSGSRWTAEKKRRIRDSRINGTRHLVDGLLACSDRPKTLICASAVGYYGDRGDEILTEMSSPDTTFMASLCEDWEREAKRASEGGIRVVSLRIGIVLDAQTGALKQMLPIFRWGVGGTLGRGRQWMSWIHLDDVVNLIQFVANHQSIEGPVNAVGPNPVTNRDFTKLLGLHLSRPTIFPVPRFAVATLFGEMTEIVFASQRVMPNVATQHGFEFTFKTLDDALADCLGPNATEATI